MITVSVPIRIDSSLSLNGRLHWAQRKRKTDAVRMSVRCCFGYERLLELAQLRPTWEAGSPTGYSGLLRVTLTRQAPRLMDDDNSVSALKAVRDEVALLLRLDDGDERLRWVYAQRKGPWGVEIVIERAPT